MRKRLREKIKRKRYGEKDNYKYDENEIMRKR